jgi:hypothetical protein
MTAELEFDSSAGARNRSDRLWDPPSFLSTAYRGALFPGRPVIEADHWIYTFPPPPIRLVL